MGAGGASCSPSQSSERVALSGGLSLVAAPITYLQGPSLA